VRAMLKLSRRSLTSNKLRFSLTTFAVLLGVSFVVASFVLTDGLVRTFDTIIEDASGDVDVEVRARDEFDEVEMGIRSIDEGLVDVVAGVDGVGEVSAGMQSMKVVPVKADGDPIETRGAPILSFNWTDSTKPVDDHYGITTCRHGEFAIDEGTADRDDLVVGEQYDVIGAAGREEFTLVGLTRFGDANQLAGAVLVSFTLGDLQRLDGSEGTVQWIDIAADGVDREVLIDRLEGRAPGRRGGGAGRGGRRRRARRTSRPSPTSSATCCSRSRSSRCS
jgi:putative ABC transport system permease protein